MDQFLAVLSFVVVCGALVVGFPVAFTLGGVAILFALFGALIGVFDLSILGALPQRIFGIMTNEVLIAVPLFILMGSILERSKIAEELLDSAAKLFGPVRGGLGISVCIVGALLAASTGIVGATVVTMGLISLPVMLRRKYKPELATGIIAASGTLGQIIPPSIVLVLLGDVLASAYQKSQFDQGLFSPDTVSVGDLFAGALIPGLLLVILYILYLAFTAWKKPLASPSVPNDHHLPQKVVVINALRAIVSPFILIVAVLGSILAGAATPTEAAAVGAVGAVFLAAWKQNSSKILALAGGVSVLLLLFLNSVTDIRIPGQNQSVPFSQLIPIFIAAALGCVVLVSLAFSLRAIYSSNCLVPAMRRTTQVTCMVFIILVGATIFSLVFRGLHGDELIHSILSSLPGGPYGAFLIVMLVMFVMGFFLDFIEITFVVVPLVAPALLTMGFDPVWLGVMMAVNLQTSFLTPPFGFALFYLRGVAPPSVLTSQIYRGAVPFIFLQIIAIVVLSVFPALTTWLPDLLLS